jgi:ABC-type phosphate transport system substrate-binding protein
MRTSIATATFLLLGAGATAVGAMTSGDNLALNGSDTLFNVTQKVMMLCNGTSGPSNGNIGGHNLSYLGGGSGAGAANMDAQTQEMAPMSRALKGSEYCNAAANGNTPAITTQGTTNALLIGLDGVSIMANSANACSGDVAQSGRQFQYTGTDNATHTYTINSSLDVLRLVYGGTDSGGTFTGNYGCAGPIRKALVANWNNIFNANCGTAKNCPAEYTINGNVTDVTSGLTHAWRRSDLSGTTDVFVTLVGFGSRKIGSNPIVAPAPAVNPFCNSKDANGGPATIGGASDYADNDPIRVTCDDNDLVCGKDNNLGLVLPILLPDVASAPTDTYPVVDCDPGACALSDPEDGGSLPCPRGGPRKLGRCYQPYHLQGTVKNFQCRASLLQSCFGDQGVDGRAYNQPLKHVDGSEGAAYVSDSNNNLMAGSFFRIHQTHGSTYGTAATTCGFSDDTQQIGCLVNADPCSIGYAGREADAQAGNQALSLNGILPKDPVGHPADPDFYIENLVTGGAACATDADCTVAPKTKCALVNPTTNPVTKGQCFDPTKLPYPIARRLYVASLVGFGNLPGGEKQLGLCFADYNIVKPAISMNNFVQNPPGIQCLDYPETNTSDPNAAFLPTCAAGGTSNACAGAAAPTITNNP